MTLDKRRILHAAKHASMYKPSLIERKGSSAILVAGFLYSWDSSGSM